MDRRPSALLTLLAAMMFLFLLAPILLVLPLSFSNDTVMTFPPQSWGTRWYAALFDSAAMRRAFGTSLWLGTIVTVLSILIALPAAFAIIRLRSRGTGFLYNLFTAPLLLPTIVLGLAMLIVFAAQGLFATMTGLVIAHLVLVVPVALRILATSLGNVPPALEEAAATLGARPLLVFWHVTLPLIRPGLLAATALSFLTSFDEAVVSLFLTGPDITTLPVALFHHVERNADPLVACVSVLLIAFSLLVVIAVARSRGLMRTFGR